MTWLLVVVMLIGLIVIAGVGINSLSGRGVSLVSLPSTATMLPRIRLIYNKDLFIIYNATGQTVSLEGIGFRRNEANNQLFRAVDFGTTTVRSFHTQQCLGMQRIGPDQPLPAACSADTVPLNFGDVNIFWAPRSDKDAVTTFVVQKGEQIMQTCSMNLNTCEFALP